MKKPSIKPISKKRKALLPEWKALSDELREKCNNRSELSGEKGEWPGVSPHHITGRSGDRLLDVFNIIFLTHEEHTWYQSHMNQEQKQKLRDFIRPIREHQGYK